jgi:hypothetical protein
MRCCSADAARLFDSTSAARIVSASGSRRSRCAAPTRRAPAADRRESLEQRHRRVAAFERRGVQQRLERRTGLPSRAGRAVVLRAAEVAPADERQDVAGARIDRHQRGLKVRRVEPLQPGAHRALRGILQLRDERRLHGPLGRVIAAEAVAELLAEESPWRSRRAPAARPDTAGPGSSPASPRSSSSVMKPSWRMRASTTWLRSMDPGRLDHGDSVEGARARPAMSAASASVSDFAGRRTATATSSRRRRYPRSGRCGSDTARGPDPW